MPLGPIEILCIKFPSDFAKGEIVKAMKTLVDSKTIRIIDILFIKKDDSGEVSMHEIDDLDDTDSSMFDPIIADVNGLISETDVQTIAESLDNHSLAALMLFENVWATAFRDAVLNAKGELLLSERIPHRVIEEVLASQVEVMA